MSRRSIFILAGLGLVVIVAAYWFLLFSPLQSRISQHDTQIEEARQQLVVLQTKLAQLGTMKDEAAKNQGRLLELAKLVPETAELPSLILEIQALATEAGITFMKVSPGQATVSAGFQVIPLTLEFSGSFFDINDFIYRAEQLASAPGRLLSVQDLKLDLNSKSSSSQQPSSGFSPTLGVNMTLNAYERNPALEPAPQTPATPDPTTTN